MALLLVVVVTQFLGRRIKRKKVSTRENVLKCFASRYINSEKKETILDEGK